MTSSTKNYFLLLNIGHFLDHYFTLIFGTLAALVLVYEWQVSYADLLLYATPGFFAFGLFSLPAGWLADRWSYDGMMTLFFLGIGLTSILTGFAHNPLEIGLGLFVIGAFAAIYHPVGLAIVTTVWDKTGMRIAINGVWGNLGVACAAVITALIVDILGWRMAFILPGIFSIIIGLIYAYHRLPYINKRMEPKTSSIEISLSFNRDDLFKITIIIFLLAAIGSLIFQATTYALPKIMEERLSFLATEVNQVTYNFIGIELGTSLIGSLAFIVFTVASLAQLIVGYMLDKVEAKYILACVSLIQITFFGLMLVTEGSIVFWITLGFMIGTFGDIPIMDYLVGQSSKGENRARVYGLRYVVSFSVLALTLPLVGYIHETWGFDKLFYLLAFSASAIFLLSWFLPKMKNHST
ncbi:MFS transporter [Curvivirga aplysinae]|uniref:MFS transporter n=1 Tax=Curvivirga aplysinae TaxID=2529852 RepID=UPI0012BCAFAE|nr:MFS transporter [Curvivirga aplysinae]MTI09189.1 MFS transporter [Curvivirga aplysinae]